MKRLSDEEHAEVKAWIREQRHKLFALRAAHSGFLFLRGDDPDGILVSEALYEKLKRFLQQREEDILDLDVCEPTATGMTFRRIPIVVST